MNLEWHKIFKSRIVTFRTSREIQTFKFHFHLVSKDNRFINCYRICVTLVEQNCFILFYFYFMSGTRTFERVNFFIESTSPAFSANFRYQVMDISSVSEIARNNTCLKSKTYYELCKVHCRDVNSYLVGSSFHGCISLVKASVHSTDKNGPPFTIPCCL